MDTDSTVSLIASAASPASAEDLPRAIRAGLTDGRVRAAKPTARPYKLADSRGLYLLVKPTGAKCWRLKFYFEGREKALALGLFPDVSLKLARERRDAARQKVAAGIDPSAEKQAAKLARADSLRAVTVEWLAAQERRLEPETVQRIRSRMEQWVYLRLGARPINAIKAKEILDLVLRRVEAANRHETAHRVLADLSRIFRHAVATARAERDVTTDLRGALAPVEATAFAAITVPAKVGELLRAIHSYSGQPVTEIALRLLPLVFVRPGELRTAEWAEIHDLDGKAPQWRIPAAKMKMRREHVVPLARQAVELLKELRTHTGEGRLLFPTLMDPERPMSNNTLNAALHRLGYASSEQTPHGFRSIASTLLNELGVPPDLIEKQLAHKDSSVRAIYNRSERIEERTRMMQQWADHLDELRAGKANGKARAA